MKISDRRSADPSGSSSPVLAEMSLMEHLEELRNRLLKVVVAYALCCGIAWFFYSNILAVLIAPLARLPVADQILQGGQLIYTAPTEAFVIRLKVTAFAGMVLALPVMMWQLWRFVTPGLHANERKYALPFVFVSVFLFALGVGVAFLSLPKALEVLAGFAGSELVLVPRAADYLSFVLILIAAFGFSFEFPIILLGLTLVGVLSSRKLRDLRKIAWVIILILAAIITPTQDPITLMIMALPLGLLYEATIVVARIMKR
ncbi:MAG TPA: twin-arginine translocase subunit TatC [Actinomycetota bacterium]|nr:twin-arginine translocase subunit TatC [Actinomycetota bacterium]